VKGQEPGSETRKSALVGTDCARVPGGPAEPPFRGPGSSRLPTDDRQPTSLDRDEVVATAAGRRLAPGLFLRLMQGRAGLPAGGRAS
jgi:hypothetical protein